jgi:hypothetical protein
MQRLLMHLLFLVALFINAGCSSVRVVKFLDDPVVTETLIPTFSPTKIVSDIPTQSSIAIPTAAPSLATAEPAVLTTSPSVVSTFTPTGHKEEQGDGSVQSVVPSAEPTEAPTEHKEEEGGGDSFQSSVPSVEPTVAPTEHEEETVAVPSEAPTLAPKKETGGEDVEEFQTDNLYTIYLIGLVLVIVVTFYYFLR